jgi:hypothetical protein
MRARGYGDFYNEYLNATDLTGDATKFPIYSLFGVVEVPGYPNEFAVPGATYGDPLHPFAMPSTIKGESTETGVFFQHTLKFADQWTVLYGVRAEAVAETATDPLPPPGYVAASDSTTVGMGAGNVSVSYKPVSHATYYGTFSWNQSVAGTAGGLPAGFTNGKLSPESFHIENLLYELGAKFELAENKLFLTTALFRQDRSETDILGNTSKVIVDGGEVEVSYQPTRNFYVNAGISYMHAIIPDQASGLLTGNVYDAFAAPYGTGKGSPNYASLPVADRRVPGLPLRSGHLSFRYKLPANFGVSANVVVTDEMITSYLGNVKVPVQYTVNAALFYEQKHWDARVSFLNLTDEENFTPIGSIFGNELIQADLPFHVEATVRYKF